MDPKIQYTTTKDAVSIAYWDEGAGMPLVIPPPAFPWSNIQRELEIPDWRHWYEHLADIAHAIRTRSARRTRVARDHHQPRVCSFAATQGGTAERSADGFRMIRRQW